MWRLVEIVPVTAQLTPPKIVRKHEYDVRRSISNRIR
jgi:hypothetical protein